MNDVKAPAGKLPPYKIHWHVLLIHFPLAFFGVAFAFQVIHLFTAPACFELATNVVLLAGTVMMVPTLMTGWRTWKTRYQGARGFIFTRKIRIGFTMLAFSTALMAWRTIAFGAFTNVVISPAHWVYLAANTLLMAGAVAEGYYGGRLNHH
jgi:uncharacterized membrane protein